MTRQILYYQTEKGGQPFIEWFSSFKDKSIRTAILGRIRRLVFGNFGDYKKIDDLVFELRIHLGPGYRVYFGLDRESVIILLCGGDKSSQTADIRRAVEYWKNYLRRTYEI